MKVAKGNTRIYRDGREVVARRKTTRKEIEGRIKEINDRYREFWELRAFEERAAAAGSQLYGNLSPEEFLAKGRETLRRRINDERQAETDRQVGEKQRRRGAQQTKSASIKRRQLGDSSVERVRAASKKVLETNPSITRKLLSQKVAGAVSLSEDRTLTLLKELGLPEPRLR